MEEKEHKKSLVELLRIMQEFDAGCSNLALDDFKKIVGDIVPEKIDNCKAFLSNIEGRIAVIDGEIKDLQTSKKSLQKSIASYKRYLAYALDSTDSTRIPGNRHTLYLGEKTTIKPKDFELTSNTYMELNALNSGVVGREYKLNKVLFSQLCKDNQDIMTKYADVNVTQFASFRINKGVK